MSAPTTCPRCGYDQSGEIARWQDSCPLHGVCCECGFGCEWSLILSPDRATCRGLFEHAVGMRQCLIWAWRTLAWCVLPWRFWSRVRMYHRVRVARLPLWLGYLWVAVAWLVILSHGVCLIAARASMYSGTAVRWLPGVTTPRFPGPMRWWWQEAQFEDLMCIFYPFVWLEYEQFRDAAGAVIGLVPRVGSPLLYIPMHAALPMCAGVAGFPLMLLALRQSRTQAKVCVAHVVRATAYSLACLSVPAIVLVVDTVRNAAYFMSLGPPVRWGEHWCDIFISRWWWTLLVWLAAWWFFAVRHGFQARHAAIVWLAMLAPTIILVYAAWILGEHWP